MIKRSYVLFILSLVLFVFPASSHAQKILEEVKKPMPDIAFLPEDEWLKSSKVYEHNPSAGEEDLNFEIRLPNDWEIITDGGMSTFKSDDSVFGEIGRFYGPPRLVGDRSYITTQTIKRAFQLTSEQWFLEYLLKRGYSVQGVNVIDDNRVEALYVVLQKQVSYIVRGTSVINGDRIILTEYYLPMDYWQEERVAQNSIMSSFKVKGVSDAVVEDLDEYMFLDIAQVKYPASWKLRSSPIRSIDQMGIELLNVSSHLTKNKKLALNGKIDVQLKSIYSTDSIAVEIDAVKAKVLGEDLQVIEEIDQKALKFDDAFEFQHVEVLNISDPKQDMIGYELWLSTLRAGDYYYFISLLSLSRDEDYYAWTRNTQTFKLINESFKPLEESLVTR